MIKGNSSHPGDGVSVASLKSHKLRDAASVCARRAASLSTRWRATAPLAACWLNEPTLLLPHCWKEPGPMLPRTLRQHPSASAGHAPPCFPAWPAPARPRRLQAAGVATAAAPPATPTGAPGAALRRPPLPSPRNLRSPEQQLPVAERTQEEPDLVPALLRLQRGGAGRLSEAAPPAASPPPAASATRVGYSQGTAPHLSAGASSSGAAAASVTSLNSSAPSSNRNSTSSSGIKAGAHATANSTPPAAPILSTMQPQPPNPTNAQQLMRPRTPVPAPKRPMPDFSDYDPQVAAAYDDLALSVGGRDPPPPLASFNEIVGGQAGAARWGVKRLLMCNVAAAYRLGRPTPVQRHVIPAIMEGRDVLGVSCTGSGKTLAYLLPLLAQLYGRARSGTKNFAWPEALVLVPTRELAEQLYSEAQLLLRGSHIKAMVATGGVSVAEQVLAIRGKRKRNRGGADLLVGTPGRLLQLIEERKAVKLGRLGCVVVDEADRMMELGMWPELRRLLSHPSLPTARQTVLVCSSLPSPELRAQADALLRDRVVVEVGDGSGASKAVRQRVEKLRDADKMARLAELLAPRGAAVSGVAGETVSGTATAAGSSGGSGDYDAVGEGPAVVFTSNLVRAEAVARQLASRGVSVALLHRDLSQAQRDEAMQCFRFGVTSVLVATGLAARGLNFPDVAHVVNYDVPLTANDYIHQVGRTGRGGRLGLATTLFTPSRYNWAAAPWLRDAVRASGSPVPAWLAGLAGQVEAREERPRSRQKKAVGDGAAGKLKLEKPLTATTAAGGYSRAIAGSVRVGSSLRRQQVVDVSDPDAASQIAFGSYLPPELVAGAGESSLLGPQVSTPDRAVVRDRRHDPAHWQAVFDEALRVPQQQAGQLRAQQRPSKGSRAPLQVHADTEDAPATGSSGAGGGPPARSSG